MQHDTRLDTRGRPKSAAAAAKRRPDHGRPHEAVHRHLGLTIEIQSGKNANLLSISISDVYNLSV